MSDTSSVNVTIDSSREVNDPSTWTVRQKGGKWLATDSDGRDRTASGTKKGLLKDIASWQVAFNHDSERRAIASAIIQGASEDVVNAIVDRVPEAEREQAIADASAIVQVHEQVVDPSTSETPDDDDGGIVVMTKEQQEAEIAAMAEEEAREKAGKQRASASTSADTGSAISVAERVATFIRRITKDYDGQTLAEARAILTPLAARIKPEGSGEREVWRHQARFLHITRDLPGDSKMADLRKPERLVALVTASDLKLSAKSQQPAAARGATADAATGVTTKSKGRITQFPVRVPTLSVGDALAELADLDGALTLSDARALLGERLAALVTNEPRETLIYESTQLAAQRAAMQAAAERQEAELRAVAEAERAAAAARKNILPSVMAAAIPGMTF
jgi:hypothetical protein